jgi:hypothetical protein
MLRRRAATACCVPRTFSRSRTSSIATVAAVVIRADHTGRASDAGGALRQTRPMLDAETQGYTNDFA